MIDMNAPRGAIPGAPWTWIRPIVILVLGVVAIVLCAGEGAVLAVGAGGGLMGTMHAILPRSSVLPAGTMGGPEVKSQVIQMPGGDDVPGGLGVRLGRGETPSSGRTIS